MSSTIFRGGRWWQRRGCTILRRIELHDPYYAIGETGANLEFTSHPYNDVTERTDTHIEAMFHL